MHVHVDEARHQEAAVAIDTLGAVGNRDLSGCIDRRDPAVEHVDALEEVTVRGANGDERGFNDVNHEGVVDDDVYFARFSDMTFSPVKDDPLSSTLPTITQTQGGR